METVRVEKRGKLTLRVLRDKTGYSGVVLSDGKGRLTLLHDDDPVALWRRLEQEASQSSRDYVGFDGARERFLRLFPQGFATPLYIELEREYKLKAQAMLHTSVPLEQTIQDKDFGEAALAAYRHTNLLSHQFEKGRVAQLLRSPVANNFIRAAARFTCGEGADALSEMARLAKPHGCAQWTVLTYLPFLWRPETHMFLKPEVTKDFAARVGHKFVHAYTPTLDMAVYDSLLDLALRTEEEVADLHPRDRIDVQSFIWVVGKYKDTDLQAAKAST